MYVFLFHPTSFLSKETKELKYLKLLVRVWKVGKITVSERFKRNMSEGRVRKKKKRVKKMKWKYIMHNRRKNREMVERIAKALEEIVEQMKEIVLEMEMRREGE